jgi:transglutaminase-like putative cysteine protease
VRFTQAQACADDFVARFTGACGRATPLMEFLARALGLPW